MIPGSLTESEHQPDNGGLRPTIETIAHEAGVSISTVSRALRNHPLVAESTCRQVQDVARRLGYAPNPYVSALMSHLRTARPIPYQATIAIADTLPSPGEWKRFSVQRKFQSGAEARARQLGYQLERFWAGAPDTKKDSLTRILLSRGIRGVLIPPLRDYSAKGDELPLQHEEFACVTLGCKVVDPGFHFATNDQYVTGQLAGDRLTELGYTRVGMAIPDYVECIVEQRFSAGFRNALERRGVSAPRHAVLRYSMNHGKAEFFRWLEAYKPDAICTTFTEMKQWLKEAGLKVPKDIAMAVLDIENDDDEWSGVNQESEMVGAAAVDLLVQLLQRNELGAPVHPFGLTIEGNWRDGKTAPRKKTA
jgi:DNA-binding LacI/PurR family transcriptional regulator